jgi:hypothetical protein
VVIGLRARSAGRDIVVERERIDPDEAEARHAGDILAQFRGQVVGDVGEQVREVGHQFFLVGRLSQEDKPVANTTNVSAAPGWTAASLTTPAQSATLLAACAPCRRRPAG